MNVNILIAAEVVFCVTVPPLRNLRDINKLYARGGSYRAAQVTSAIKADWPWFVDKILKLKVCCRQLVAEPDQDGNTTYRRKEM